MAENLTSNHILAFGGITYNYARIEGILEIIISDMLNIDVGTTVIITEPYSSLDLRNVIKSLNRVCVLPNKLNEELAQIVGDLQSFSGLRNNIAHSTWTDGDRPDSIKPSHRAPTSYDDKDTYQRLIGTPRLRKIAKFIDSGGQFPTNIVINIKTKNKKGNLKFDQTTKDGAYGTLHLPGNYGCAWIIDGQHRLYAYEHCEKKRDDALLSVLAYVDMPVAEEIDLFIKVNHEQVKVARNLIEEIQANINWNSPRVDERLEALHARIGIQLNKLQKSPIKGRVKLLSDEKSPIRHFKVLTLVNIKDGLTDNDLVGKIVKGNLVVGPLGAISHDFDEMLEKSVDVISGYLDLFSSAVPEQWEAGDIRARCSFHSEWEER